MGWGRTSTCTCEFRFMAICSLLGRHGNGRWWCLRRSQSRKHLCAAAGRLVLGRHRALSAQNADCGQVDSNFKLRHYRKVRYLYSPGAAAYRGGKHLSAKTKSPGSAGGRGFLLRLGLLGWRGWVRGRVLPRISILVAFLRSFHPSPLPLVPSS